MLEKIKLNLRIKQSAFDEQIVDIIEFVKKDLTDVGIVNLDENDPIIIQVCTLKAKSDFDYQGKGDWYLKQYEKLKSTISIRKDYTVE